MLQYNNNKLLITIFRNKGQQNIVSICLFGNNKKILDVSVLI